MTAHTTFKSVALREMTTETMRLDGKRQTWASNPHVYGVKFRLCHFLT